MSSPTTITVQNIAAATSDKEVQDFFSFCGKITNIQVVATGPTKSATVDFEKDTAAKTALLLNNTQLGPNHITVSGIAKPEEPTPPPPAETAVAHPGVLTQEEKPRARIFAEYLAHGYVIGDAALERAIELDHKHNVTNRFATTLQQLDSKYHATDRAKTADQSYGISHRANSLLTGLGSYFEKASSTPTGKRMVDFYTAKQRQVKDIHEEARRLAEIKKQEYGGSAYKAAGLDKYFGEEKKYTPAPAAAHPAPVPGAVPADSPAGSAPTAAPTASASAPAAAPSAAPAAAAAAAPVSAPVTGSTGAPVPSSAPKFDPPPTAPTS